MEKTVLHVEGMSCSHCEKAVTNALTDLGVSSAKASAKDGTVEVEYDGNAISIDAIKAEILDIGYEVK